MIKKILKKIIPDFVFSWYHFCLAYLGAGIYGFPSRKMFVIGVTGTKGKTTTCNLLFQILNGAEMKAGMATTVNFGIGDKLWINSYKQTMLGRFRLQKLLSRMASEGCKYAVIETSSEGILQHRHRAIDYSAAILTNVSPEHIERHGSFENYRSEKLKLFEKVAKKENGTGIYNLDDRNIDFFLEPKIKNKYGFVKNAMGTPPSQEFKKVLQISDIELPPAKTAFVMAGQKFEMPLIGEFNVYNAAAAICFGLSQEISAEKIKNILVNAKPAPGRMEIINEGQPFTIVVDYAHEPASLEAVYKSLKIFNPNKIIAVLGSQGGGRDKAKRPILGSLAGSYADVVIITNEDPYDEDPEKIINDVALGVANKDKIIKIIDRREAIKKSLKLASSGDIVVITGKGGEISMCVENGRKIPWKDSKIIEEELKK
ncbi:MAG: UDP-N-acetylmuramyl-tripeptide synthetase [Candidatus Portnoybacteria bacterium]|nr:UDP-N-acetylmuramyl-tripeptide synthetase [Candidatus Portnoybacteria bacterium]